ncbi:MAG: hypothetical protein FJX19_00450 [Alphaproteobacteria bacterium]|nr:hypothetical protein [Alphaproteobacteria bacterium]
MMPALLQPLFAIGLALGATLAAAVSAPQAAAQVMRVEAVGQAVDTVQGAAAATRRRALEEALYQAAMIGGAEVKGFTALSRSEIVTDQLVVRPASRILDYAVIAEERVGEVTRVRISAMVGEVQPIATCPRDVRISVTAFRPSLSLDHRAPAWMQPVVQDVAAGLLTRLDAHRAVDLTATVGTSAQEVRASTKNPAFDYATLTGMRPVAAGITANGFGFDAAIAIRAVGAADPLLGRSEVELEVRSRLFSGGAEAGAEAVARQRARLPGTTTLALMNPLSGRDRQAVVAELTAGLEAHVDTLVREIVCRPLVGPLAAAEGGVLVLPFGRRHGLTRNHIAYTEGDDTPYTLLEIVEVADTSARLRPIDRARSAASLVGATARFMELR